MSRALDRAITGAIIDQMMEGPGDEEGTTMGRAQPNFRIGDHIGNWLSTGDEDAMDAMRDYRDAHPRKFAATLAWAVGRQSERYNEIMVAIESGGIK